MNDTIEMTVSPITHDSNGKPQVFVVFSDGEEIIFEKAMEKIKYRDLLG